MSTLKMSKIDVIHALDKKGWKRNAVAYLHHCLCKMHNDLHATQVYCIINLIKKSMSYQKLTPI